MVGPQKDNEDFVEQVEEALKIKKLGALRKYNGNDFEIAMSGQEIKMSQKKLIKSMVKEVEIKSTKIPGFPNNLQVKDLTEKPLELEKYRRLVGKLLYVCNKTGFD